MLCLIRLKTTKIPFAKLLAGLFIIIFFSGTLGGVAFADSSRGCYQNSARVTCPANTEDTNGQPLQPSNDCYVIQEGPPAPGTSPASGWTNVECSDLSTPVPSSHYCGASSDRVYTSIDLGCVGKGNPIMDMLFGIIRFLSDGVGIIVIASIIVAGIQYTTSGGDPQAAAKALTRLRSSLVALLIFIFAYAILNYLIPGTFLT